ncbi:MAG: dihydropteroate synthase [Actinomycetota bacterium]|jgi:dihydropteroate synthase|nr:dihydropteroate synthase [Actinomycetota bacterium]
MRGFPELGRTRVMGIVNVTPDSFSDAHLHDAVEHGRRLLAEGADLVDVGGESTRPGATRVPCEVELERVLPVVRALVADGALVSVDTTRAAVARAAVDVGAVMVNDVSGGLADARMLPVVAELGVPYVAMHWRGPSADMQSRASYDDVVVDVCSELADRRDAAGDAGIADVVLDPGLGFAKNAEHNWALLRSMASLQALGRPLLVGASRKAFLGALLDGRPASERDAATAAITTLAASAGVWGVRVHDVASSADAVRVVAELAR